MAKSSIPAPPELNLDIMTFSDWLFDIAIWEDLLDEKFAKKKGSFLYQHLKGKAKETVRNEVPSATILSENGLNQIIGCLKKLYQSDQSRHEYDTFDKFIKFKRPDTMSIKDYLVDYNLLYNKVEVYAGALPEAILGYSLLENANLSEEKKEICRATCSTLTYDTMKIQIEKVCVGLSVEKLSPSMEKLTFSHDDQKYSKAIVKSEPTDDLIAYNEHLNDPKQDVLYNKNVG